MDRPHALGICAAVAILSGCGASLRPIGAPGAMPQSRTSPLDISRALVRPSTESCPTSACIYVANSQTTRRSSYRSITVYPASGTGNITPYRTIAGAKTGLYPDGLALDSRGKAYVSNPAIHAGISYVSVYSATADGNVKPLRSIAGRATLLLEPGGVALDTNRNVYAANNERRCHGAARCIYKDVYRGYVTVYAAGAKGNVAPIRIIRGTKTGMFNGYAEGISVDGAGYVYVATTASCRGVHFRCRVIIGILVYSPGADGDVSPSWTISGSNTRLSFPRAVAVDEAGNVYVVDYNSGSPTVYVYAAREHGNVAPVQSISGSRTGLLSPTSVAVDLEHDIYVTNLVTNFRRHIYGSVTVYAAGATGNVAPIQTIKGPETGLLSPLGIAIH
jgi:hypothetical protein